MFDLARFERDLRNLPRVAVDASRERQGNLATGTTILSLGALVGYSVLLGLVLGPWAILAVPIFLIAALMLLLIVSTGPLARPLRLPLAVGCAIASMSVLVGLAKLLALA